MILKYIPLVLKFKKNLILIPGSFLSIVEGKNGVMKGLIGQIKTLAYFQL